MRVRPLAPEDVGDAVALRQRIFTRTAHPVPAAAEAHFRRVFFEHPWHDPALPSLVCEDRQGRVIGFLGCIPRRMRLDGETLRVAVPTQLCVEREASGLVAVRLIATLLAGPQDLTWSDAATDRVCALWTRLGGEVAHIQSLSWRGQIRPSQSALAGIAGGIPTRAMRLATRLVLRDADARVRDRVADGTAGLRPETVDGTRMLGVLQSLAGDTLVSTDTATETRWLLEELDGKHPLDTLRCAVLRKDAGLVGASMVLTRRSGIADVVALQARPGAYRAALWHAIATALEAGQVELRGRLEPALMQELDGMPVTIRREAPWTLLHSRRADVRAAVHGGRTSLTRLDGEWWLNF